VQQETPLFKDIEIRHN